MEQNVAAPLRKIFEACVAWRAGHAREGHAAWPLVSLTLRSGESLNGYAAAIEDGAWVLDLAAAERHVQPQDRVWLQAAELASLRLEAYPSWSERLFRTEHIEQRQPAPDSVLALRRRTAQEFPTHPVEFTWPASGAGAAEIEAAWAMIEAVGQALRELSQDAYQQQQIEAQIQQIRICAGQGGRFRLQDGVLEAGFVAGELPPPAGELHSLLAMIL